MQQQDQHRRSSRKAAAAAVVVEDAVGEEASAAKKQKQQHNTAETNDAFQVRVCPQTLLPTFCAVRKRGVGLCRAARAFNHRRKKK